MRTVQKIYDEMAAEFARKTGLEVAEAGDLAVRLYAVAAQICALTVEEDWVARQCFPQTATGESLERHAVLRGLRRQEAGAARGVLRFSVDTAGGGALEIPAGTVCMTAGLVRFVTEQAGVLAAGTTWIEVAAVAAKAGSAGNVAAGSILTMAVAPVGIARCSNPAAFAGGTDRETDETLRVRVLETFQRLPNGANAAFYQQGALSFPEVAAAAVLPRTRGIGTVDVVVATGEGVPGGALLERLRAYFMTRREIAVDVQVRVPTVRSIPLSLAVKPKDGYDFQSVKAAVEGTVRAWFNGKLLGKNVLRAQLGELIFGTAGVENYSITAPSTDVTVGADELPKLGSLTVTELGGGA